MSSADKSTIQEKKIRVIYLSPGSSGLASTPLKNGVNGVHSAVRTPVPCFKPFSAKANPYLPAGYPRIRTPSLHLPTLSLPRTNLHARNLPPLSRGHFVILPKARRRNPRQINIRALLRRTQSHARRRTSHHRQLRTRRRRQNAQSSSGRDKQCYGQRDGA